MTPIHEQLGPRPGDVAGYIFFVLSSFRLCSMKSWRKAGRPNPFAPKKTVGVERPTREEITRILTREVGYR